VRLYSYVVARDYGFAPNPFYGYCTLATCKPLMRKIAAVGDWVIGTGAASNGLTGHLVFAMEVTEAVTFEDYFADPRFEAKKPDLAGSRKRAFGDNIYYRDGAGRWQQLDSHHALPDGSPNPNNIANDTQSNRVLVSNHFSYFGVVAPEIPHRVRTNGTADLVALRGYKNNFEAEHVMRFVDWLGGLGSTGAAGRPAEWLKRGGLKTA
jgi:hypothetical protein